VILKREIIFILNSKFSYTNIVRIYKLGNANSCIIFPHIIISHLNIPANIWKNPRYRRNIPR